MTADRRLSLVLLTVMITCAMLVPILAAWLIPDRTLDRLIALPWTVITPVLTPAIIAGIAAVWGFFTGSLTPGKPERVETTPPASNDDDAPTTPLGRPRRTTRGGFATIDALLVVVVAACVATLLHGCGTLSPRQVRLAAIETAAVSVGGAADLVSIAATADAESCRAPAVSVLGALDEGCMADVELRWAPADTAIDAMRFLLGTWLAGEAFAGGEASFAETAVRMLGLYADLVALLASLHVELPPLVFGGAS